MGACVRGATEAGNRVAAPVNPCNPVAIVAKSRAWLLVRLPRITERVPNGGKRAQSDYSTPEAHRRCGLLGLLVPALPLALSPGGSEGERPAPQFGFGVVAASAVYFGPSGPGCSLPDQRSAPQSMGSSVPTVTEAACARREPLTRSNRTLSRCRKPGRTTLLALAPCRSSGALADRERRLPKGTVFPNGLY